MTRDASGGDLSRRTLFRVATAAGAAAMVAGRAGAQEHAPSNPPAPGPSPVYLFFNPAEAAFIEAAVDRLIPNDDGTPGALEADVPVFIDRQLAGAYGNGAGIYLDGPWREGFPGQGYQLPFTPALLYRLGIRALAAHLTAIGAVFEAMSAADRDRVLGNLEAGRIDLGPVPSAVFFSTLLANTIEGFFADPAYG